MAREFTFGAGPERLRRLLFEGMEEPEGQEDIMLSQTDDSTKSEGQWIGSYQLIGTLGEGGMGIVYLAKQVEPMRRQVALKIIKPGMDSKRVIARFEAERQALALLEHPNIAHVYEAGATEVGRPYFVMEYVKGLPITDYCDHHKLTIEDRLNLFRQVCLAVHYAHQKGIIHRDIKPSNILISLQNDQAVPKIIDFGVAKAITQPLTERTLATEDSQLLGTPEYMSPEQADMANEDIDTQSDIYSLGVLLYVLLTGILPFDSDTLREGGIDNIRKVIREIDPRTPSTQLTRLGEKGVTIAQNRRMEIQTLARHLRKELEWIPLKAMRKERSERYRSASELADEIENYLKGAPLIAGPLSTMYRFKKFVRRNKVMVGGTVAIVLVSFIGAIVSLIFALGQARARAEAQSVTRFLSVDVLEATGRIRGRDVTAVDVLDIASKNLESKFQDQPLVEAQIRWRLGRAWSAISDPRAAIPHIVRSYQLRREHYGERGSHTVRTKNYLGLVYVAAGQYKEAEHLFDELIQESNPNNVVPLLEIKCNLALVYIEQGRYKEAEYLLIEALSSKDAWWQRQYTWQQRPYLEHLGEVYLYQGRYEEAEQLFKERKKENDAPYGVVSSMFGLGCLYTIQKRYDEAEKQFREGIEFGRRELPGKDHRFTLCNINGFALLRTKQKLYDEAERLFHEALEGRKLKLGEDHPHTLETKNDLAVLYKEQSQYDEAEKLFLEAVEGRRLKLGDTHPHTLESWNNLIDLYEAWGKSEKAEEWRANLLQTEAVHE